LVEARREAGELKTDNGTLLIKVKKLESDLQSSKKYTLLLGRTVEELKEVNEKDKVLRGASPGSHTAHAAALGKYLQRIPPQHRNFVVATALHSDKSGPGDRPLIETIHREKPFKHALKLIHQARDLRCAQHLQGVVFSVHKSSVIRVLLRMSGRGWEWARSVFKWKHGEKKGEKKREMMASDSTVPAPELPSVKKMLEAERKEIAASGTGNLQHLDGQGSYCENPEVLLLAAIEAEGTADNLRTAGTAEDPHVIITAGDGCRGYQSTTWVRVGWIIATTKGSNQSTRHVHDWLAYKGGEAHATCTQRVAPVLPILQRVRREGGQLRDKDGDLTGIFVKFAMGGDKPWLRHVLGQRSHNHTYFSHSCPCAQKDMYDMSQDHTSHYPCGECGVQGDVLVRQVESPITPNDENR
jgi:hypothetical protein